MTIQIADDLGSNYDQLRRDRGWTWAQMADNMLRTDPVLAAWMREQKDTDDDQGVKVDTLHDELRHDVARSVAGQMVPDGTVGPIDRAAIHQEMARLAALLDESDDEPSGTQSNGEPPATPSGRAAKRAAAKQAAANDKAAAEKAAADQQAAADQAAADEAAAEQAERAEAERVAAEQAAAAAAGSAVS